jgi:hypothetical protein
VVKRITNAVVMQGIFTAHVYLSGRKRMYAPSREALTPSICAGLKKEGFEVNILHALHL